MSASTLLLQPNPLFVREARVRWRGRAFLVMFAYIALLALAMGCIYASNYREWRPNAPLQSMAYLGHSLFMNLSWIQILGWMLLAPALTATSIAVERELGLLESLQMSPLSAASIVWGKLTAALVFITLVLLAAQPIAAVCFLLGGVSPVEFVEVAAVQFMTAVAGAMIGLCCSAWSRHTNTALAWTGAVVLIWGIGSTAATESQLRLAALFGRTNPIFAVLMLVDPGLASRSGSPIMTPPWMICLGFEALLTMILFWYTARGVSRPMPEPYWQDQIKKDRSRRGTTKAAPGSKSSRWELPFTRWLHFRNPLLQREVRAKFRWRRLSLTTLLAIGFVALYPFYLYIDELHRILTDPGGHRDGPAVLMLGLIAIMIASMVMGATGFTGERQAGTWDSLALSSLRSSQILTAKLTAPLLACAVYALPFWPLVWCCIGSAPNSDYDLTPPIAASSMVTMVASAWCCTAWGLWVSWRARRTATAVGWALGLPFGLYVVFPAFIASLPPSRYHRLEDWFGPWHPGVALAILDEARWRHHGVDAQAMICAVVQFGVGCCLVANLHRAMRYNGRQRDGAIRM